MTTFKGFETVGTSYTGPTRLVYNPVLAIIDKDTVIKSGIYSGPSNYMRISDDTPNGKTLIQFLHFVKVTDDHVDEAELVGTMEVSDLDLRNLSHLLMERVKQIDQLSM